MQRRIILIRHAASSGQDPEAELTTEGVEQANKLAPRLNRLNIDALFSSPYLRALETINPFAQSATLSVSTLDNLRERCLAPTPLPDWPDHIERSFKDTSYKLPGRESLNETCDRALKPYEPSQPRNQPSRQPFHTATLLPRS